MAPHFHRQNARSRQSGDWRGARHLVIEGEARVIGRRSGSPTEPKATARPPRSTDPVWGAALNAAERLRARRRAWPRVVLPTGAALLGFAVLAFALAPSDPVRHSAGEPPARMASAPMGTLR